MEEQTFLWWETDTSGELGNEQYVLFDSCLSQTHIGSNSVTEHPIELGADIADHVIQNQDQLNMTCEITNTPIALLASARYDSDRAQQSYELLLNLKQGGYTCTILTSLQEYENMILTSLEVPRDAPEESLRFVMTFKKVTLVENESVDAPEPDKERGKPKKKTAKKDDKPASRTITEKNESVLSSLLTAKSGA